MKTKEEILQANHLQVVSQGPDGGAGWIHFAGSREKAGVVWSWGMGWEHVSVSFNRRCPTWAEMCKVKDMFWPEDETVVQYHPKKKNYVNVHEYCLHLWRKKGVDFEEPPTMLV